MRKSYSGWLMASLLAVGVMVPSAADAAVVVTIDQSGPDVVARANGSLELTGPVDTLALGVPSGVYGSIAALVFAPATASGDIYEVIGPSSFGSGSIVFASSSSGDIFGLNGSHNILAVPVGYVSGSPISSTAIYSAQTLASLGLTPGSYVYRQVATGDTVTVNIGLALGEAPEPSTWAMMLLGFGALGLALRRRREVGSARAA